MRLTPKIEGAEHEPGPLIYSCMMFWFFPNSLVCRLTARRRGGPAAQLFVPGAVLWNPPLTKEFRPLAVFRDPPLTEEKTPLAVLAEPPDTEEMMPLAVFTSPPPTQASTPLALLLSRSEERRVGKEGGSRWP